MITLLTSAKELHHHLCLNSSFHSDLQWWASFLPKRNGVSMMAVPMRASPGAIVVSDASGNWGCSAYSSQEEWFQFQWPESWAGIHIIIKELLPIVMSCAVRGKTIKCVCDNTAMVAIINSGRSKDNQVIHFMRCLTFLSYYGFILLAEHLPGKDNIAADALSRNNLTLFHQCRQSPNSAPSGANTCFSHSIGRQETGESS